VKDKQSKVLIDKKVSTRIFQECLKRGLLSMAYGNPIRIIPPLILTEKVALQAVDIFDEVFSLIQKDGSYK
jgi:4-aminobutyrate aminotransferase-like enzyme